MFYTNFDAHQDRRRELLREAQHQRLVKAAQAAQCQKTRRPSVKRLVGLFTLMLAGK